MAGQKREQTVPTACSRPFSAARPPIPPLPAATCRGPSFRLRAESPHVPPGGVQPRGKPEDKRGEKLRPAGPVRLEDLPTAFPRRPHRLSPAGPPAGAPFFHPRPAFPHGVHKYGRAPPIRLALCALRRPAGCGQKQGHWWTRRGQRNRQVFRPKSFHRFHCLSLAS